MPPLAPPPKDATRREHVARVTGVIFASAADDFVILALADGQTAMGPASADEFDPGLTYRFVGRWEDDPKRGYRFRFATCVVHGAHSKSGVVKYLTDLCPGVGPKTADRLWAAYGSSAVEKLRDTPELVILETGLNPELVQAAADELRADARFQATKIDLAGLFAGRGFQSKLVGECVKRWGAKAAETVRRNPYRLLNMTSAGFKRCDRLYLDLGLRPDALKRQIICSVQAILKDRDGHTWLTAERLATRLHDHIPTANPAKAFKGGLRAGLLAKRREGGQLYLTTANRAYAERLVADSARRLAAGPNLWPTDRVPVSREEGDRLPSEHQVERLTLATAGPLGILIGGPGTGKTHTLAYLVKEVVKDFGVGNVALVAPTGKAAVRMTQAMRLAGIGISAGTMHSKLIECGRLSMQGSDDEEMDGFGGDGPTGLLEEKVVVMDETSMCDTTLMALFLSACPDGTHVLLIGDPYQLPPVGHGSPLRDLIAAGLPCGELTAVRRNAGQIVHACLRIKNGEQFETTDKIDLAAEPPRNLRHIPTRDDEDTAGVLESVLSKMTAFNPVWNTQVIVARNKGGALTRKPLNDRLQQLLNPDGLQIPGNPFRVGDKVIGLKNCRQHAVEFAGWTDDQTNPADWQTVYLDDQWTRHREPKQVYVANGEIGRVLAVGPKEVIAVFSEGEYAVRITLARGSAEEQKEEGPDDGGQGRGCHFDLAYAVTCHKLQGSEAPCVIVVADPQAGGVCTREWWYTAVSRAAKVCLLIGPKAAIDKQRVRVNTTRRKTFLAELLTATDGTG